MSGFLRPAALSFHRTMATNIPSTNKKVVVTKITQKFREAIEIVSGPMPTPKAGEALVKNRFVGINASDINATAARYDSQFAPTSPPFDTGFEAVGEIVQADSCRRAQIGQSVAYTSFGAFAEYTVVPEKFLMPVPSVKAEFLPFLVSGLTASISLDEVGEIKEKETVLITAAAGGTGQFAVQIAKNKGCHVIGTCSTDEKVEFLKKLGVDRPVNYTKEKLKDVIKNEYPKGLDCVYETIGGEIFDTCLSSLAIKGRLIVIGFIQGYEGDLGFVPSKRAALLQPILLGKSASVRGFLLNHYTNLWGEHLMRLVKDYSSGKIISTVDNGTHSAKGPFIGIDAIPDAVDYLYSKQSVGKIVVEVPDATASRL